MGRSNKERKYVDFFNPDVSVYNNNTHQDFLIDTKLFDAGSGYEQFNDFILKEALDYSEEGNGVTYIVWNIFNDVTGEELGREIVAYYTLSVTAIPFEDRIRLDEEEAAERGEEFDIQICGVSALKIDMFAVHEKYQDLFWEFEGDVLPISAWIMRSIIDYADTLSREVAGFKAIFLHALPNAEQFYLSNGFHLIEENMYPLHCMDSEYKAMYLALKPIHMNYDR